MLGYRTDVVEKIEAWKGFSDWMEKDGVPEVGTTKRRACPIHPTKIREDWFSAWRRQDVGWPYRMVGRLRRLVRVQAILSDAMENRYGEEGKASAESLWKYGKLEKCRLHKQTQVRLFQLGINLRQQQNIQVRYPYRAPAQQDSCKAWENKYSSSHRTLPCYKWL